MTRRPRFDGTGMLFNSWVFWIFLPVVLGAYFVLRHRAQNLLLLLASWLFYAWWDWRFLGLLIATTVIDYFVALGLDQRLADDSFQRTSAARKRLLVISIIANLGVLGFFKYFGFFEDSLVALLGQVFGREVHPSGLDIILPVGISFYTFQSMSYTIDVYRGELRATSNPLEFATCIAFFPHLVAGPILRASDLLPQVVRPRRFDAEQFNVGGYLIVWGLFKKIVVADNLAPLVDATFAADAGTLGGATVLFATYAFAFQIYCDFSGYTDIARGVAKLMGFEFPLNFNLPYVARTPSDFWRRWHISLSSWLRDYLYIPLGGNRGGPSRVYLNLMLTMLLGGLWHGAAWTFVAWGAYQGLLLCAYRFAEPRLAAVPALARVGSSPAGRFLQWLLFFHFVCLGWLLFRAESFGQIQAMLGGFARGFDFAAARELAWRTLLFASPIVLMQAIQHFGKKLDFVLDLPAPARGAFYASCLVAITAFGQFQGNAFIYFQF